MKSAVEGRIADRRPLPLVSAPGAVPSFAAMGSLAESHHHLAGSLRLACAGVGAR